MAEMAVREIVPESPDWKALVEYASACSWSAGPHLAKHMRENDLEPGDTVFALVADGWRMAGYCTLCKSDYIPDCPYTPWCGYVFVDEDFRGQGHVGLLLAAATAKAREKGFETLYVCSDHVGLYERYGFTRLETRLSRDNTPQGVFARGTRY